MTRQLRVVSCQSGECTTKRQTMSFLCYFQHQPSLALILTLFPVNEYVKTKQYTKNNRALNVSSHWCSDALGNIEQHQMTCMANMELCVNCVWSVYVCACVYQCMPGTV